MEKFWLICYDISNPKRLGKVAKILKRYGVRVQRSVFECWLSPGDFKTVKQALGQAIDKQYDSIRYYSLCGSCRYLMEREGDTSYSKLKKYYIV